MKIIFILYNIFESKSGVSNKYIKFIDHLSKNNIEYILFTSFQNNNDINTHIKNKYNIINKKGINVPFYKDIKIPNIKIDDIQNIINNDDIIIFNGEFFWLYKILSKIKNTYPEIKIIPNWHTNYDYYSNIYFKNIISIKNSKNILYDNLKNNFFSGIIVTGELTKKDFIKYTPNVFNANEICLDNFNIFKIDEYNFNETINFIYTGRISKEKNLNLIIDILNNLNLDNSNFKNFKMHIIGDGPCIKNIKNSINKELKHKIIFYGDINYSMIQDIYTQLNNRIFIQSSKSETFGKSTMEACYSGIPVFVIECDIHNLLYNDNNSFTYGTIQEFKNELIFFFKLTKKQKENVIYNGYHNSKQYDQNEIFQNLQDFLINMNTKKDFNVNKSIINNIFSTINHSINYFES